MGRYLSIICGLSLVLSSFHAREYSESESLDNGNYNLSWIYDNVSTSFYFKVEVNATGWVGFGVSKLLYPSSGDPDLQFHRESMDSYDVLVGGLLRNGTTYHRDYLTDGHRPPNNREDQNWIVTDITEIDNKTTLVFHRKKDTGDRMGDIVIEPGYRYVVWAYHRTRDATQFNSTDLKHEKKGLYKVQLLEKEKPPSGPRINYKRETPTTGASTVAASLIGNLLLLIIALIFFY